MALTGCLAACGSGAGVEMSGTAESHLDQLLGLMQAHSVNRHKIDWTGFRSSVYHAAANAVTVADLNRNAIPTALRLLGDHRSSYIGADGTQVPNPDRLSCAEPPAPAASVPSGIGYVKVDPFTSGTGEAAYAESMLQKFRDRDAPDLAGWIIDVRGIGGGNMYPILAGLATVLGEGDFGSFVNADGDLYHWGFNQGYVTYGAKPYTPARVHSLIRPNPKIAVLTDCSVASSGEAVVISFRGRPNTRSFGTPTLGHSTAHDNLALTDGSTLYLVAWTMADRSSNKYGGPVVPDEVIRDPAQAVQRAAAWLME